VTTEREVAGPAGIDPARPLLVRRFGRRMYQITAVACLVAAVQAAILAAVATAGLGRWLGFGSAVVLAGGAVTLVVKSIPYEHVRFGGRAS
jgi:hypothetical protein